MSFIRNRSHSFCAVKIVHLQRVKQNLKKQSRDKKIQMGNTIRVTRGMNQAVGKTDEFEGTGEIGW